MSTLHVKKAFGKTEPFSEDKLRRSLLRSGASEELAHQVADQVKVQLYEGMTTKEIYKNAFELLKQLAPVQASRYKLKEAINELGPSGFPFERFVAALLRHEGYATQTGVFVEGHCVKHEIDVTAQKEDEHFMIECKFHNKQGQPSDVKVPLYIQSRFLDVAQKWKEMPGHGDKFHQAWIVTNTRFTEDATQYGSCMGMKLISWDYPQKESLRSRIDHSGLYPISALTTLTQREKQMILQLGVVLCKDLCHQSQLLQQIGISSEERVQRILSEGQQLCRFQHIDH